MNPIYVETARLLTQIAPLVLVDDTFALKGWYGNQSLRARYAALVGGSRLGLPDYTLPREQALYASTRPSGRPPRG